ncbi:PilZ domain-containing protein [Candidatus Omnitrophota bacterium]
MINEKRQHPRLEKTLPLKLSSRHADIVTQTKNLSCNGAYCTVNKNLPLMTKLKITLLLPEKEKSSKEKSKRVTCVGVVVRSELIRQDRYDVAIFFEQIREKEKVKLEEYVTHHLTA